MTHKTKEIKNLSLPLPIAQTATRIAQQFSQQQPTPAKAEQVRLNTLAVCVVNDYLQMMSIATDLSSSDTWNSFMRLCVNVADLEVIGVGRLECRSVKANEQTCYVPPEVWEDRIGYVVVQLDEEQQVGTLLGFIKNVTAEWLHINQLQPIENLLAYLIPEESVTSSETWVKLSQWRQNVFETGWQAIADLLSPAKTNLAFNFRKFDNFRDADSGASGIRRARLIDLGMQLSGHPVALIVEIRPESLQKIAILLQIHPTGNQIYLPPLLQLMVLDESETIFLEAQARRADNYIQLQFSGNPGERFKVKVALGDAVITENFVI